MKKLCIILALVCSGLFVSAQSDSICFPEEQVLRISNKIKNLEQTDSLQKVLIGELKYQNQQYKDYQQRDSLLMDFKNQEIVLREHQVELYLDLYKQTKPKWYDKKFIWFSVGAGTIISSSWVVSNIKP